MLLPGFVGGRFYGEVMYRSDLERLMTLSTSDVDAACRGERLVSLTTRCFDEHLELAELADEAAAAGDLDAHGYYSQEGAAWRATAQILRTMAADPMLRRTAGAA
ncbi:hypothetical protein nbrc107696_02130 [Gordonia spumicola]|uniref:TY-Chap C-terminal domain-containing protein n=2 Tax=Gordonia spumicola TaxID=589161 RepID=A0A7I9V3H6_9ACTN|nr:hypothetical protein nbrc107696_02130 [Gordonia spumicola]